MHSTDVDQPVKHRRNGNENRKSYVTPALKPLTRAEARTMLLRRANGHNPKLLHLLDCIEESQSRNGS
jgi:hypothetical protein